MFAFTRLYGDPVAYNAMLQGRLINRSSPHTAGAPPLIAERLFGLAGAIGEFSISRSVVGRAQWDTHGVRYGQRCGGVALEFSTRFQRIFRSKAPLRTAPGGRLGHQVARGAVVKALWPSALRYQPNRIWRVKEVEPAN